MANDLNLNLEWVKRGVVRVSWTDTYLVEFQRGMHSLYVAAASTWGIVFILMALSIGLGSILIGFAGLGAILFALKLTRTRPNAVTISATTFKARMWSVPTNRITRIEYGKRSQWTGYNPPNLIDPTEIRVWIDDDTSHVVSTNNWQPQVNHRIRNALEKALLAVRAEKNKTAQVRQSHGRTNEYGMPNY